MDGNATAFADGSAPNRWAGLGSGLVLLGLVAAQAWLTLGLFGDRDGWQRLHNDQPILSGRHPLHLYHGYLGSRSLMERGTSCCYDPAFQAGYPKTPVFDGGCRPAELFLSLGGARYQPAAYKIGLAVCCLLAPLVLAAAAWCAGLGAGGGCVAALLGMLVWWGHPCRELLEVGDLDLLLGGLAAVLHVGLLIRFHRSPGLVGWFGLLLTGCLGWFGHPQLFLLLAPLVVLYYLSAGVRHGLGWHLTFLVALGGGLAANLFWLLDWVRYWWMWVPAAAAAPAGARLDWSAVWTAPWWGLPLNRALMLALLAGAVVGLGRLLALRQRLTARLVGVGTVGLLGLAVAGLAVDSLQRIGATRLVVPALWFAIVPATAVLSWIGQGLRSLMHRLVAAGFLGGLTGATAALAVHFLPAGGPPNSLRPAALEIGLGAERQALVDLLRTQTTSAARILWEDCHEGGASTGWTALLPLLTDRVFLGGLDPRGGEAASLGLVNHKLAGRPLAEWSDADLAEFARRYNVGWVVCRSPTTLARFEKWTIAEPIASLPVEPGTDTPAPGRLFRLRREAYSFILKGQAQLVRADRERIVLADVVPENGQIVLSLHYQTGWRVTPGRVRVEGELDPHDPASLIRLCVPGPVTRISLTWQPRE